MDAQRDQLQSWIGRSETIEDTVNPFTTVERKDVGLTLRVRPTTNERSIESSVLVEDGGLVMLAGLLSDTNNNNNIEKVPLAGDIPVLGNLFKNENRTRNKSNLIMFLRPAVMRDGASTEAFAYDRYDEIRGRQIQTQPSTDNIMLRGALPPTADPVSAREMP